MINPVSYKPTDSKLKTDFDKLLGNNYCISIQSNTRAITTIPTVDTGSILKNSCTPTGAQFNTILVLPYNKDSLVKVIGIDLK